MKTRTWGDWGWNMNRLERWLAVQMLLPRPGEPVAEPVAFFEANWLCFLDELPEDRAMSAGEFAKLAYFTGAMTAFIGLAQHDQDAASLKLSDKESHDALEELALEPLEYLRARGIRLP